MRVSEDKGMKEPDEVAVPRRSRADRLHQRLRDHGASRDAIVFALEEDGRRDEIRNAALREKVRSLTAQTNEPNRRADGPVVGRQGVSAEPNWDTWRLTDLRDEIVDVRAMLTLMAQSVEGLADGRSVAELSDRLRAVSDQVIAEKETLALLADQVEGKADGHALAQLNDRLAKVSDQIADATGVLIASAGKMEERADSGTSSELADALAVALERTRQILWVLSVGIGAMAPAVVVLLALTIWSMVTT